MGWVKYRFIWNVPYKDTRDRCASCFKAFGKQVRFFSKEFKGQRFDKLCRTCHLTRGIINNNIKV